MIFRRNRTARHPYRLTDRARRVFKLAQEEARRLKHEYVGTEHLLLGLIRDDGGVAVAVLRNLSIDLDRVREVVEGVLKPGRREVLATADLPYTSRAKKGLELAMQEAKALHHSFVGTEYLLLGLLGEERGIAAQVLGSLGLTLANARDETVRLLNGGGDATSPGPGFPFPIDDTSARSIHEQIIDQVQEAVATGRLRAGDRLPTVRQLADQLDIAPGTVARAYSELERLGVVITEGARGTRVAPRKEAVMPKEERPQELVGLLRPVVVAAFHVGATAEQLRRALEVAMKGIYSDPE